MCADSVCGPRPSVRGRCVACGRRWFPMCEAWAVTVGMGSVVRSQRRRVPAQMWANPGADVGESRRRCGRIPAQMWPDCYPLAWLGGRSATRTRVCPVFVVLMPMPINGHSMVTIASQQRQGPLLLSLLLPRQREAFRSQIPHFPGSRAFSNTRGADQCACWGVPPMPSRRKTEARLLSA